MKRFHGGKYTEQEERSWRIQAAKDGFKSVWAWIRHNINNSVSRKQETELIEIIKRHNGSD